MAASAERCPLGSAWPTLWLATTRTLLRTKVRANAGSLPGAPQVATRLALASRSTVLPAFTMSAPGPAAIPSPSCQARVRLPRLLRGCFCSRSSGAARLLHQLQGAACQSGRAEVNAVGSSRLASARYMALVS